MKLSISLSDAVGESLGEFVRGHNSNPSAVAEAALLKFRDLPYENRESVVRAVHDSKKMLSVYTWRETFLRVLAEEFDQIDAIGQGRHYAPRVYEGYTVVFHLSAPDEIVVHAADYANVLGITRNLTRTYKLTDSVFTAARDMRIWIRTGSMETL